MTRAFLCSAFSGMLLALGAVSGAPSSAAAATHAAPYARLASDLGTPDLVHSEGPKDRSLLELRYVGRGQSETAWDKMTTISIAKVKPGDTQTATRSIIAKFKAGLEADGHAKVSRFDQKLLPSQSAYFEFHASDGVAEQGVAYSPAAGFVSVIQIAYRHGYVRGAADRAVLEAVIAAR